MFSVAGLSTMKRQIDYNPNARTSVFYTISILRLRKNGVHRFSLSKVLKAKMIMSCLAIFNLKYIKYIFRLNRVQSMQLMSDFC